VGKNKLARWTELSSFDNVIEPGSETGYGNDHPIKGKWRNEVFNNNNPVILELGCGKGEYTTGLALRFPQNNYIGVDIKGARMWRGAKTSNEKEMPNVAFLRTRIEFINSFFAENEIDEIWLTFPDPQPGKRNSNKRLTCPWFLNIYRNLLKDNGIVHLKTDNTELFVYTKSLVERNGIQPLMATCDLHNENIPDELLSIRTHYETIFLRSGMKINYLSFRLNKNRVIQNGKPDPK
jgi:tRNA (guanine-N7-)-methyltransferase